MVPSLCSSFGLGPALGAAQKTEDHDGIRVHPVDEQKRRSRHNQFACARLTSRPMFRLGDRLGDDESSTWVSRLEIIELVVEVQLGTRQPNHLRRQRSDPISKRCHSPFEVRAEDVIGDLDDPWVVCFPKRLLDLGIETGIVPLRPLLSGNMVTEDSAYEFAQSAILGFGLGHQLPTQVRIQIQGQIGLFGQVPPRHLRGLGKLVDQRTFCRPLPPHKSRRGIVYLLKPTRHALSPPLKQSTSTAAPIPSTLPSSSRCQTIHGRPP